MAGLILEGGAFRGLYTDGVLDALLDEHILFDYVIGVSAGISNGYSYCSLQRGRSLAIIEQFVQDNRYFGWQNFFRCRSIFGLDFVFDEIPNKHIPFDYQAFDAFAGRVVTGVTDADTGEAVYFEKEAAEPTFTVLRASCAIPLCFPVIPFRGRRYFDGGLADPIPIKKAIADGNAKNLVVLTRPAGYVKKASKWTPRLAGLKYKNLTPVLEKRHQVYNESVAFCEQQDAQGDAVLLRPSKDLHIERFERDLDKLRRLYQLGYEDTMAQIERIRALL